MSNPNSSNRGDGGGAVKVPVVDQYAVIRARQQEIANAERPPGVALPASPAFRDKPIRLVFGTNPSDRHHKENALHDLRREMGVKRLITKHRGRQPSTPPHRRPATPVKLPVLTASPLPDPWAPLRALAAANPAPPAPETELPEPRRIRLRCPQFGPRTRWQEAP